MTNCRGMDLRNLCMVVKTFYWRQSYSAFDRRSYPASSQRHPRNPRPAVLDREKAYDKVRRHEHLHKLLQLKSPIWLLKILRSWLQISVFIPTQECRTSILFDIFMHDMLTFPKDPWTLIFQFSDDLALVAQCTTTTFAMKKWEQGVRAIPRYT